MKDNKGFSLIEVLVGLAVLAVAMAIISGIMFIGSTQYRDGIANSEMQKEARVVLNQIENMLLDTNGGVTYSSVTDSTTNVTTRTITLYNAANVAGANVYTKEEIKWISDEQKVYYSKWNVDYDATAGTYSEPAGAAVYVDQLMAENITDFVVDVSDTVKEKNKAGVEVNVVRSVSVALACKAKNGGSTYVTNPVVTLRNRMMLSSSPEQIFDTTPVVAETLSVYMAESGTANILPVQGGVTTVQKGNIYYLHAIRSNQYDVNDLVDWDILEPTTLSSIDDETGALSVNSLEPNTILTLKAYYEDDPSKEARVEVRVDGKEIRSVELVRMPTGNGTTCKYVSHLVLDGFSEADKANLTYQWEVSNPGWMETFNATGKDLLLTYKPNGGGAGKSYTVKLTVSAPECNSKSMQIGGIIPNDSDAGDSCILRGGGVNTYTFNTGNIGKDYSAEVYFCDEAGKRITVYDAYISQYVVFKDLGLGQFSLEIKDGLPGNITYYLKYVASTALGNYERIIEIPMVQLLGQDTQTTWTGLNSTYTAPGFLLYGSGSDFDATKYEAVVQYIECDKPAGVEFTAKIDHLVMSNGVITGDLSFTVTEGNINASAVKVHSVKVKMQLKGTDVFAYSTLTFTE